MGGPTTATISFPTIKNKYTASKQLEAVIKQAAYQGQCIYYSSDLREIFRYLSLIAERGEKDRISCENTQRASNFIIHTLQNMFFQSCTQQQHSKQVLLTTLRKTFPLREVYNITHIYTKIQEKRDATEERRSF